jgi:hypothetical protein
LPKIVGGSVLEALALLLNRRRRGADPPHIRLILTDIAILPTNT